jgi:hypothetical protein
MPAKKPKTKKAEPKLQVQTPVTQIKIPARHEYERNLVTIATDNTEKDIAGFTPNAATLNAVAIGDFLAVQNDGCNETFILHKDVLNELAALVNG